MTPEFNNRTHSDQEMSERRFCDATRSASFNIQLGIREIRMLQECPWSSAWSMQATELATLQKLIDKGLLLHENGKPPALSSAGRIVRQLLIMSKHIDIPRDTVNPYDVLHQLQCAILADKHDKRGSSFLDAKMDFIDCDQQLTITMVGAGGTPEKYSIPMKAIKRVG